MASRCQLLVLPCRGSGDPRFVLLRLEMDAMGRRLQRISPTLPDVSMRPLPALRPLLRLLP